MNTASYRIVQYSHGKDAPPRVLLRGIFGKGAARQRRTLFIHNHANGCGIGYRKALEDLRLGDGDYLIERERN